MTKTSNSKFMIMNSIVWASVMLGSALVAEGTDVSAKLFMLLLTGWLASSMATGSLKQTAQAECAAMKRFVMRGKE